MTSVERVYEYIGLPSEAQLESAPDNKPDESWPKYGILTAEKAVFKYKEDSPPVLKGLSFCIRSEEKVKCSHLKLAEFAIFVLNSFTSLINLFTFRYPMS